MCFTEQVLENSDATVTIVDRRDSPGGHWRDAYSFVRLHQPSRFYGLGSMQLGDDYIDAVGGNAGMYELAGRDAICLHFETAMHRHFLPSGRVRYLPNCDYSGDGRIVSLISGETRQIMVRRKVIDARYLQGTIPATDKPTFDIADGVHWMAPGELARLAEPSKRFVIMGGGKTALDTCVWLLERGVDPDVIEWIRPRDAWWLSRRFQQPGVLLPDFYLASAMQVEAFAEAADMAEVCTRLEADGVLLRIDPEVTPSMFRAAITSEAEIEMLRRIRKVHRMGHILAIEPDRIVLEYGTVPTGPDTVHVHCSAAGLGRPPLKPIFEPNLVTIQPIFFGFACLQYSTLGAVETLLETDDEKNALCPPIHFWDIDIDYALSFLALLAFERRRAHYPALDAWARNTRLNPISQVHNYADDPRMVEARGRIKVAAPNFAANVTRLLAGSQG